MNTANLRSVRLQTFYPLFVLLVAGALAVVARRWTQPWGVPWDLLSALTTFVVVIAVIEAIRRATRRP